MSQLNSAILHHQTDYKCPAMSDCPYTGKTLLEKRQLGDKEDKIEDFADYRTEAASLASFTDCSVPFIMPELVLGDFDQEEAEVDFKDFLDFLETVMKVEDDEEEAN